MKCKVCGRPEEDHHEFVAQRVMPERCVCDARSWGDDVVPICRPPLVSDAGPSTRPEAQGFHEVVHVMLCSLVNVAVARGENANETLAEEHAIIQRLARAFAQP